MLSMNDVKLKALTRIHAHLCGDGCLCRYKTSEKDRINRAEILYFNNNTNLLFSFKKDMSLVFNVSMSYNDKQKKVYVKSIRIATFLLTLSEYKSRSWRIPSLVKNANSEVKLEWIKAFALDEGYIPKDRNAIRIKSVNFAGLQDIQQLLQTINIRSTISGPNCDHTWYLNIRKENALSDFYKISVRK